MAIWRCLFANDDDFESLPGSMGRLKVDGKKVLDFVPPPERSRRDRRVWRRRRVCWNPYCSHDECRKADEDDIRAWYAPRRLREGAKFDENLRYPMPARYLKKHFPFKRKSNGKFKDPVAIEGRPWPEGPLCMPSPEQAQRFVMRNPEFTKYLLERKQLEIGQVTQSPRVQADFGPCIRAPMDATYASWLGVNINMKIYRLAALQNDIVVGRFTQERALREGMEGSQKCHFRDCIAEKHLAWEQNQ